MTRHLIIPFRDDPTDGRRRRLLEWCVNQWWNIGFRPTVGITDPAKPWIKAAAVTQALNALSPADDDVLAIVDADVFTADLFLAFDAVDRGNVWAMPHVTVQRLNEWATDSILAGENPVTGFGPSGHEEPAHLGMVGGGITVLPAHLYRQVPLDPRFVGWGQEDEAWGTALVTMFGEPFRIPGTLWHLWHRPAERLDRDIGSEESVQIRARYWQARGNPTIMQAVLNQIPKTEPVKAKAVRKRAVKPKP